MSTRSDSAFIRLIDRVRTHRNRNLTDMASKLLSVLLWIAMAHSSHSFQFKTPATVRQLHGSRAVPNPEAAPEIFESANYYAEELCEEEEACDLPGH